MKHVGDNVSCAASRRVSLTWWQHAATSVAILVALKRSGISLHRDLIFAGCVARSSL